VSRLKSQLQSYVSAGSADPTSNLNNDPDYIFSGKNDRTVVQDVVKIHEQIYSSVGADIKTNYNLPDNHGFATDNYGGPCASLNMEFINNCNFNLAYDILNHIFGGNLIKPSASKPALLTGQLVTIEQSALMNPETVTTTDPTDPTSTNIFSYWAKWLQTSMAVYIPLFGLTLPGTVGTSSVGTSSIGASGFDKEAFVYYPANCTKGKKCPVHVALHGCLQGKSKIGDVFAKKAGYLEVAELNDIIIFFPQVVASFFNPSNPQGCWDWMGYSSPNYANKLGPQMEGVKKMVDSIKAINGALAA